MLVAVSLLIAAITALPPLSQAQIDRLAKAVDGRDHLEDAFEALVENVRQWGGQVGDAPIRLNPDLAAMLDAPALYRGDLCRLSGRIQQQTALPPPFEDVHEWFIRSDDGQPIVVYVVASAPEQPHKDGAQIEVDARFYKRVDFRARDGQLRSYPAFAGAFPRSIATRTAGSAAPGADAGSGGASRQAWTLATLVTVLLAAFAGLLIYARRRSRRPHHAGPRGNSLDWPGPLDEHAPLPDDPAEALAELKRRASAP